MSLNYINSLESIIGSEAKNALESFSRLANKSTRASHPLDQERWFRFLVIANKANKEINVEIVINALKELGWSTDSADELGLQFEFAESLLSYIDE